MPEAAAAGARLRTKSLRRPAMRLPCSSIKCAREDAMNAPRLGSRHAALIAALALMPAMAFAAPPPPSPITPALIEAAKKEGKVVLYTSIDVQVVESLAKGFEKAYPGVSVQVERNGAERNFQRLGQERGSSIFAADVLESSHQTHFPPSNRQGCLHPH